jgi:hypothetical protein
VLRVRFARVAAQMVAVSDCARELHPPCTQGRLGISLLEDEESSLRLSLSGLGPATGSATVSLKP